jgi:hypothetical protein|tara:strand:- start:5991 stop:6404 length:414 start_codon:yes stop_codon:yes gene_type:complete
MDPRLTATDLSSAVISILLSTRLSALRAIGTHYTTLQTNARPPNFAANPDRNSPNRQQHKACSSSTPRTNTFPRQFAAFQAYLPAATAAILPLSIHRAPEPCPNGLKVPKARLTNLPPDIGRKNRKSHLNETARFHI